MSALNLVTGYQGVNHVTAAQWADLNRGIIADAAILHVGNEMNVEIQTANQITVLDGVAVFDGREFYIGYGESVNLEIASGTQGMMRNDIVVIEYNRDESSGVESAQFKVIEGTPAASNQQDPAYSDQDIRTGVFTSQKPFCRVRINGTAIEGIDMLVDVIELMNKTDGNELQEQINQLNSALALMNALSSTDGSSFNKNFLDVGISNKNDERNKRTYFVVSQADQSNFTNVPPGLFKSGNSSAGVREVYRISQNLIMIKITEIHPAPGTQYYRTYNNGAWNSPGWKIITPE